MKILALCPFMRNIVCQMFEDQSWCGVARPEKDRSEGWVAGRDLRESSLRP